MLSSSKLTETPQYLVQTPHFYLVTFIVVASIFAFDAAVLAVKEIFVDKSKEKALRKLMKSIPKKQADSNKWVLLADSAIDCQTNLLSFMENQETISKRNSIASQPFIPQLTHQLAVSTNYEKDTAFPTAVAAAGGATGRRSR